MGMLNSRNFKVHGNHPGHEIKLSFTLSTANDGVLFGIITVQGRFEAEHAQAAASPALPPEEQTADFFPLLILS